MNQRSNVAYPARGQLNRENEHSPVPPFSFYTKEFGPARRVRPSRPASGRSFSTLRLNLIGWCLLTGFPIPPPPPPPPTPGSQPPCICTQKYNTFATPYSEGCHRLPCRCSPRRFRSPWVVPIPLALETSQAFYGHHKCNLSFVF